MWNVVYAAFLRYSPDYSLQRTSMANSDRNILLKGWVEHFRGNERKNYFYASVLIVITCLTLSPLKSWAVGCPNGPDHHCLIPIKHIKWYECQSNSECVIVAGNCGVEWATNKNFAERTRAHPPRAEMPCSKPLEMHPANTVAACENHKCVLSPPGFYAGGVPMPHQ